jgi:PAS domain-containing protein
MRADRERHLAAVRHMVETMDVFVFTFGHTETWRHKQDGAILQLAPGVAGGEWSPDVYEFYNMTVSEVISDFLAAVDRIRELNPNVRIVLSVSPVGIIATYEDRHVIESNSAVKAILRAAADEIRRVRPGVAYFPSYDLATVSPNVSRFYRDDTRRITSRGIDQTMRVFFDHFTERGRAESPTKVVRLDVVAEAQANSKVICDEEAIEAV